MKKKLKRKNRTIDRVACDDKSIKSKALDARNKLKMHASKLKEMQCLKRAQKSKEQINKKNQIAQ